MARVFEQIDDSLAAFIGAQRMFFVATAPLDATGLVNLSPKGLDTLRILDPHTVAYLDLTGSGVETIAHLRENGRIAILFCSFEGSPEILRLHGQGAVLEPSDPEFAALRPRFPEVEGNRSIIRIAVKRIATSCGYAVPLYQFEGQRSQLLDWARNRGTEGLERYRREHNSESLDGLPALRGERPRAGSERNPS